MVPAQVKLVQVLDLVQTAPSLGKQVMQVQLHQALVLAMRRWKQLVLPPSFYRAVQTVGCSAACAATLMVLEQALRLHSDAYSLTETGCSSVQLVVAAQVLVTLPAVLIYV